MHYRPPFSRDPAPRVAFLLKKVSAEHEVLWAFCQRCGDSGLRLASATAVIDTPHPIWEGRAFSWRSDSTEERPILQYSGTRTAESEEKLAAPLLLPSAHHRRKRTAAANGRDPSDFIVLDELAAQGHTDFIAIAHRFGSGGVIDEIDCVHTNWTTQKPGGFDAGDCAALRRLALGSPRATADTGAEGHVAGGQPHITRPRQPSVVLT